MQAHPRNFVAKHCRAVNKAKVYRDRKNDYSRKSQNRKGYE